VALVVTAWTWLRRPSRPCAPLFVLVSAAGFDPDRIRSISRLGNVQSSRAAVTRCWRRRPALRLSSLRGSGLAITSNDASHHAFWRAPEGERAELGARVVELSISVAGDRNLLARLGIDASLDVNFLVLGFVNVLQTSPIDAITDLIPSYNSVLIQYDFTRIDYDDLCTELRAIAAALPAVDEIEIESRLAYIPVCYLDPWTRACIDDYRAKIAEREYDPEFVAEVNGLPNAQALAQLHASTEHWVVTVSSFPGLPILRPLDPRCAITSPKYNPPRLWTPVGSIGVGGTSTSIYTIPSPGGYNLIGRTPVPIWQPQQRLPAFAQNPILLRPTDRLKFIPISVDEFEAIEESVAQGRYEHNIVAYQRFSVGLYKQWAAAVAPAKQATSMTNALARR
jgi:urea carboxylase